MPAELARQRRGHCDQGEGEGSDRAREPLMRLGAEARDEARRQPLGGVGVEQLRKAPLARVAGAGLLRAGGAGEVNAVLAEAEHGQPRRAAGRAGPLDLLAHPVQEGDARALRRVHDAALAGEDGDRRAALARIVHQDAAQGAVGPALARIDGEVVADGAEHALLQQHRGHLVADLELPLAEGGLADRHQVEVEPEHNPRREEREDHRRPRQAPLREPGGAQHHQLAVEAEPDIDEEHHDEGGDRQDDGDEIGQQQAGQTDEDPEREAALQHQLDEAERLDQPHQRRQAEGDGEEGERELAEDVTVYAGHGAGERTLPAGGGRRQRAGAFGARANPGGEPRPHSPPAPRPLRAAPCPGSSGRAGPPPP